MKLITKFYRGTILESFHVGYAVVVDEKGETLFSAGDPDYPVFIRSAAAPFQAAAVVESGAVEKFKLNEEEIAMICSSHNAESYHVDLVANILKKADLKIEDLLCGTHSPLDKISYEQLILQGRRATAIHNNCSGKHAGMLAAAKALGLSTENYIGANHPVQQKILEKIKMYSEREKIPTAVDICNAPTYFMPLKNLALMYRKLVDGADESMRKVYHAMTGHPKQIAGRGRFDTDFIIALGGKAVAKIGSDGVRGVGLRTENGRNIGVAIKVLSGNWDAINSMTLAVLKYVKVLDEETLKKLEVYSNPVIKSYTEAEIGKVSTEILLED